MVVVVVVYASIYLPIYLSICLAATCKLENEAVLRDFLNFWTWQHQKRNNSARRPQFSKLTTSKTKQFCEMSSIFEVDNIKNERILWDCLQKWKVECRADGLVPIRVAIFPLHLSKILDYTTVHYITLHHNYDSTKTLQLQLQLHYTTLHPAVVGDVTEQDHCNHCKHSQKHNFNHLSVHQWICSAIRDSQQPSSRIYIYTSFLFWNFRHCLVRYYW